MRLSFFVAVLLFLTMFDVVRDGPRVSALVRKLSDYLFMGLVRGVSFADTKRTEK